jgi:hypothetical protein
MELVEGELAALTTVYQRRDAVGFGYDGEDFEPGGEAGG